MGEAVTVQRSAKESAAHSASAVAPVAVNGPRAEGLATSMMRLQRMMGNQALGKCLHGGEGNGLKLQRKCACEDSGTPCSACAASKEEQVLLHRNAEGASGSGPQVSPTPASVQSLLRSPGEPLDLSTRTFMESSFAHDFGDVRVHTDSTADKAVHDVSASAFAVGRDIAFGQGKYSPGTESGRHLIAHELAHTVQQGRVSGSRTELLEISQPGDASEREADSAAQRALSGAAMPHLSHTAPGVHRGFPDPPKPRTAGLTEEDWAEIRKARKFFNLPDRPTKAQPTIVGVLKTPDGEKMYVKSGEDGGPWGGTQRGSIPRGAGEAFTGGGPHQGNISTHVEGHAAAIMHQRKIPEATLLIEEAPCEGACDATRRWDPIKGEFPADAPRPGTPNISTALPPKSKLTIVDPETTGIYRSAQLPPAGPVGALEAEGAGALPKAGINTPPPKVVTPTVEEALAEKSPVLPKVVEPPTPKMSPKSLAGTGVVAAAEEETVAARALGAVGNIAMEIMMLVGVVVWELVVAPKIEKFQTQINQWMMDLEKDRRKRMQEQIRKKFEISEAKQIGRIVKSCYLGRLRDLEKAGKKTYVNVTLKVSFEDTSGRFHIPFTEETPPESIFDLEFYDVDLGGATVSDKPVKESVGKLTRCESCGALGRDKSFISNNPLFEQTVEFSFEAPKAGEIAKEFEKEPDVGECIGAVVCFIATACYGSLLAPEVETLRRFRDRVLAPTRAGRLFVAAYYRLSPPVAGWLTLHPMARRLVRLGLIAPTVYLVRKTCAERLGLHGEATRTDEPAPSNPVFQRKTVLAPELAQVLALSRAAAMHPRARNPREKSDWR